MRCVNPDRTLSLFLIFSGVTIIIGAAVLRVENLVPDYLTYSTLIASVIIFLNAYFLYNGNRKAKFAGVALGVIAIAVSSNPSHFTALAGFGQSFALSIADAMMVLGFYMFPVLYISVFILGTIKRKENRREMRE